MPTPAAATSSSSQKLRVAIVGAGASGLAAARVFSRNGIEPTVLEQNAYSGGVWKYQEGSKTSPMYRGLRTNLPKEIMQFREFPFPQRTTASTTSIATTTTTPPDDEYDPSFVTHGAVLDYLQAYQTHFDLTKYIHYGSTVQRLEIVKDAKSRVSPPNESWPQIRLEWKKQPEDRHGSSSEETNTDIFDVVCICNGHYAKPAFAKITGLHDHFQGTTLHSVAYDNPADFQGQRVLCVGGRASGSDLAREISAFAQHVYLSDSTCPPEPEIHGNITVVPPTREVRPDGSIRFEHCTSLFPTVDCIIFCTGYDYDFPFLRNSNILLQAVPGERRVVPLYEQLWHAQYPNLSFFGIPHSVVPFPAVEFQAEAILGRSVLSVGEILELGAGSVVELNRQIAEPVDLVIQGVKVASGEVVVVDDCFAIRIKEIVRPVK